LTANAIPEAAAAFKVNVQNEVQGVLKWIRGPRMPTEWVFFDGDCGFCHRWVQLVV
jgi:hypothetical protein